MRKVDAYALPVSFSGALSAYLPIRGCVLFRRLSKRHVEEGESVSERVGWREPDTGNSVAN